MSLPIYPSVNLSVYLSLYPCAGPALVIYLLLGIVTGSFGFIYLLFTLAAVLVGVASLQVI